MTAVKTEIEIERLDSGRFIIFASLLGVSGVGDTPELAMLEMFESAHTLMKGLRSMPPEQLHSVAGQRLKGLEEFFGYETPGKK